MALSAHFIEQMNAEADATRQVVERIPPDKYGWRPHAKSWTMLELATHLANLVSWGTMIVKTDGLDFESSEAKSWTPPRPESVPEILELLAKNTADVVGALGSSSDDQLRAPWIMRSGARVIWSNSRASSLARWVISHQSHHRGELMVNLRLNDIALPPIFGPTADEGQM